MSGVPKSGLLLGGAAVILAAAALLYPRQPSPPPATPALAGSASAPLSAAPAPLSASQVERGIETARAAVERNPQDAAAWAMLAHSHEMQGQFEAAGKAYTRLLALRPQDAQVHADTADALGVAHKGSLQGEPAQLIAQALALDPKNLKALVLGGKAAFERQRYAEAIALWERALAVTGDGAVRRPIATSIAEARVFSGAAASASSPVGAGLPFVAGRVTVAPALRAQIAPDDTVFIYARPVEGSRMPIALLRKKGRDLPLDFALDDSLAMVPQARLSQHRQLQMGVRVSRRGDAIPASGDLEGELGPVTLGATGLNLEISRARP
jgi:cytochrome c-type biogenesis protein CcmH